jgi:ferredoxin-NADP reductase
LYAADTVLCIAGGIGITHVLGFVRHFAHQRHGKRLILAWSARERPLIDHVRRNFLVHVHGAECKIWYTGETANKADEETGSLETSRMNIREVMRGVVEVGHQRAVLVCAPGAMADEVTYQVVDCAKDGFQVQLVEEAFAW